MTAPLTSAAQPIGKAPTFAEALRVWARIGLTSFGGPAGQIALMHRVLVDDKKWLDERTYLLALNFCTLLPGHARPRRVRRACVCGGGARLGTAIGHTPNDRHLAIWFVPLLAIAAIFGFDHVLVKLAWFFSKLAIVTFGGAYAVLAYMAQAAVQTYGWLQPGEMLDGLGLAETTPGPLILVTEFVAFLAAYRQGGEPAVAMGILGALVALWATFAPCFLYIFAGAPYIEQLKSAPRLKSALSAITAAVVGVILNLSVWFALHVVFREVGNWQAGPLQVLLPNPASLDLTAAGLALLAAVLLFRVHAGIMTTLGVCGLLAVALAAVI